MDLRHIELVQESFAKISPNAAQAKKVFVTKLYELRSPFGAKIDGLDSITWAQMLHTLDTAISNLNNPGKIVGIFEKHGFNSIQRELTHEIYENLGEALIYTLQNTLGEDFTLELKQAWLIAYSKISAALAA